ncbi:MULTISPECIES: Qat anti-phage system QueC-like protein QatC [Mannheimia]|uniref:7-cyano-7-deazaguanine synthase n=1 Tax=Mannheimia pernigra TaxID=111844 RepID=A0ABD7A7S8_9PAST|nr:MULTISPECIES: Qat anti-phage system QueC-like protein QatC [Mannheimia]QLB42044.1 7-cyano-7-deazaguanine synthase [Mannheimia pernigra]QLB45111.1 7-cyano-7-deazaguanine synthase [Mannheimia pernigra]QTM00717.1 DNA-binding protein [Mannheimia sp. ZY171111]
MTQLVFHHDIEQLKNLPNGVIPVHLYGVGNKKLQIANIGNKVLDEVKRLSIEPSDVVMDFLTIALAVTAADTFVLRKDTANGWCRSLSITLPLCQPDIWQANKTHLEQILHFLSGDIWQFNFQAGGKLPPQPHKLNSRAKLVDLRNKGCVCLFSGGLDSAIGAIDLLEQGYSPVLVSHSYKGDKSRQQMIVEKFNQSRYANQFSQFNAIAQPHLNNGGATEITMRTRSLNFLAFAVVSAYALQEVIQKEIDIFVPENGVISINAPLTSLRVGTLSTRTTHPYFIQEIQKLFTAVNIPFTLKNPYQFKTKGQMIAECKNLPLLRQIIPDTVSCSHWKRKNQQCGVCVPCLIRRASLHYAGITNDAQYEFNDIRQILINQDRKDDLFALIRAIHQKNDRNINQWVLQSGRLPIQQLNQFANVFVDGLNEVEQLLIANQIL